MNGRSIFLKELKKFIDMYFFHIYIYMYIYIKYLYIIYMNIIFTACSSILYLILYFYFFIDLSLSNKLSKTFSKCQTLKVKSIFSTYYYFFSIFFILWICVFNRRKEGYRPWYTLLVTHLRMQEKNLVWRCTCALYGVQNWNFRLLGVLYA